MRPAVSAGLVGAGIAAVAVIGLGLVFAIQALVFLAALPLGLLIGWYAGVRADAEPAMGTAAGGPGAPSLRLAWPRALAGGLVAGLVTALALAIFYALMRLTFLYLDNGFRAGADPYACSSGPECSYQRALDAPQVRAALEEAGVADAAAYTGFFLEGQLLGGATLIVLVLGGALGGSAIHRLGSRGAPASTMLAEGRR